MRDASLSKKAVSVAGVRGDVNCGEDGWGGGEGADRAAHTVGGDDGEPACSGGAAHDDGSEGVFTEFGEMGGSGGQTEDGAVDNDEAPDVLDCGKYSTDGDVGNGDNGGGGKAIDDPESERIV